MSGGYFSKRKKDSVGLHVAMMFLVLFQLFPLIILMMNGLRLDKEIKNAPIGLPSALNFSNYVNTWERGNYLVAFRNSFVIGICTVCIVLVLVLLAAYALAREHIPFRSFFIGYFTLGMSIPGFLYIVPNFQSFSQWGISNTHLAMIIIYSATQLSFQIILVRSFLVGIPREMEQAAKIDGCNRVQAFYHVTLPIARPIILTSALLVFVATWNEFLWSNTFLISNQTRTVSTRYFVFVSEYTSDLSSIYTAGVIAIAPVVLLYVLLQKRFIEGMTAGAIKG